MTDERRRDEAAEDALVAAAWRNASRDQPPARLDAAILAAARAATRRPAPGPGIAPRRAWWTRWQPLAAAAGVAGLAFVLVQTIPREARLPSPAAVETKSRAESPASRPVGPAIAPAESTAEQAIDAAPATLPPARTPAPATTPPATISPATPPPATSPTVTESAAEPLPAPPPQAVRTREVATSPAAEPAARDASVGGDALGGVAPQAAARAEAAAPTPDAWARRIAALHAAGNLNSAAAELREFRLAFPEADRFLPDDLRAWAAGVPRPEAP